MTPGAQARNGAAYTTVRGATTRLHVSTSAGEIVIGATSALGDAVEIRMSPASARNLAGALEDAALEVGSR